jgi:uncharacterized protein involved in oxidation of intracellular sulfur
MNYLFIFNDSPYGTSRTYNGLRLAVSLKKTGTALNVFLIGDSVLCALGGLNPAHEDYNPQAMLTFLSEQGARVGVCKTCIDQRGISPAMFIPAAHVSTLQDLTAWTEEAEKVLVF